MAGSIRQRIPGSPVGLGRQRRFPLASRLLGAGFASIFFIAGTTGCQYDSWFDPSVTGRWESTPITVPILERLDVIETEYDDVVEVSQATVEDLIPNIVDYIVGPGDLLNLDIFELFASDTPYIFMRQVDQTGKISVPLIGDIYCAGLTESEIKGQMIERLREDGILNDPEVSVIADRKQQNMFSVMGLGRSNTLPIPKPRFLLLEALAMAGISPDTVEKIYIIRPIPLREEVQRGFGVAGRPGIRQDGDVPFSDERSPWMRDRTPRSPDQPADEDVLDLIEGVLDVDDDDDFRPANRSPGAAGGPEPALDIPTPGLRAEEQHLGDWVYLNGQWVQVSAPPTRNGAARETVDPKMDARTYVTSRVIEIPVKPLLEGDQRYNIIVRPNDVVRIPAPPIGQIYMKGQILRPGSFNIPPTGKFTLTRAIASAGGLGPLAIPQRVEITRIVGHNRQATVMINLKAIAEGVEPDILLKPDDMINVGTTWYAAPVAVVRNGFRASYGFGFLLDRNFGTDVFGAPPTNPTR